MASDVHPMQAPAQPDRDEEARHPWHLSREWVRRLGGRAWRSLKEHRLGLMSQALAYSALFAVFPGLVALISVYGLVARPEEMTSAVQALGPTLPGSARQVLLGFVQALANTETGNLTVGVVIGFVLALWSASSGTGTLIQAISIAYDEPEERSFFRGRALALALTLGVVLVGIVALFGIAGLPALLPRLGVAAGPTLLVLRWFALGALALLGLGVLYRVVPRRVKPTFQAASFGAAVATVLWIGASLLFALFVSEAPRFGATYGSLAGVIVLMLWFYLSGLAILLGAEMSAESAGRECR